MQRVLLVSANPAHAAVTELAMRADGRELRVEPTSERALAATREWRPQLILLDLGSGLSVGGLAAFLRDPHVADAVGVIAIAGHAQLTLAASATGLDDFVLPPLDAEELRLRVSRALWQRTGADDANRIRRGNLLIDLERYQVSIDGEVVDLTYKEYELLCFLASNPGKPFTREALLNRVWGYDYYGGSRTVDVHIRRIRSKIDRNELFIETVRNVGYRFAEELTPRSAGDAGAREHRVGEGRAGAGRARADQAGADGPS